MVICDEPRKENSVNQLLDYFETIWEQEDSGYFHNDKKLANRKSVKKAVLELQEGYQQYFNENKGMIFDTDYTDETFETEKIALVSNPIHSFQGTSSLVSAGRIDEKCEESCKDSYTIYYL